MRESRGRKRVGIVQSCYIPWKGYFDLINSVDEFVLYDDRQFTRRDWRNRNRVKTRNGTIWLTVPVHVKGRYHQRIDETVVAESGWARAHWRTMTHTYTAAPYFDAYRERFAALYEDIGEEQRLSAINRRLLEEVCDVLGIGTKLSWSTDYDASGTRTERLIDLCRLCGADEYLSGPTARAYLDENAFRAAGIEVTYMNYDGYPTYPQLYPPFEHTVSALDLLFQTGPEAPRYMMSFA
jgi:hypothetical protein